MRRHRIVTLALFGALLAGASGCFNPFDPRVSTVRAVSTPAPVPNSAANVVRLFEWCWKNRAYQEYQEVFTDDYRFQFADADSAGDLYKGVPYTREDELRSGEGIFVGNDDHDAASDIAVDFDKTLISLNDDRPGKDPGWHKSIRTRVNLNVTIDRGAGPEVTTVSGHAKFYLVRGDSAAIPPELAARGFKPDPNRWWIERWEDETLPTGGSAASTPAGSDLRAKPANPNPLRYRVSSFGALKVRGG